MKCFPRQYGKLLPVRYGAYSIFIKAYKTEIRGIIVISIKRKFLTLLYLVDLSFVVYRQFILTVIPYLATQQSNTIPL